jgi:hypothetical protein
MPQVMRAERTFWEQATAIHVFCAQGDFRGGDRFARHWHDVTRLDAAGFADAAMADKALAKAVADHKSIFFAEKSPDGEPIDYHAAVSGGLRLVPDDGALAKVSPLCRRRRKQVPHRARARFAARRRESNFPAIWRPSCRTPVNSQSVEARVAVRQIASSECSRGSGMKR